MSSIGTYSVINAKVRAMRSQFLSQSQYRQLIESASLREFWPLLSNTRYAPLVKTVNYQEPAQIEHSLLYAEIQELIRMKKYCKKQTADVVQRFMERYDGEKLKVILRCWYRQGKGSENIFPERILYAFPVQSLLEARNIEEFILLLDGTSFYKILKSAARDFNETRSLFPLELAIDRYVYQRLLEIKSKLNRRDRSIVERLIGVEIDLKNLEWIGRFKKYYSLSAAQIGDYLLPHGYKLGAEQIRRVLGGDSLSDMMLQLMHGMKVDLPSEMEGELALEALDYFLKEVLMQESRRAFAGFPFTIGAVLGYIYLMRQEMKNIRSLIQAKQYELPEKTIEPMVVY
ncbi:V-type ATPase subunit [bacterium]|nr:V-type ATPase subunit [bacterium]